MRCNDSLSGDWGGPILGFAAPACLAHYAAGDLRLEVRQKGGCAALDGAAEQGGLGERIGDLIVDGNELAVLEAAETDVAAAALSLDGRRIGLLRCVGSDAERQPDGQQER